MSGAAPMRRAEAAATNLPPRCWLHAAAESIGPIDRRATTGWPHRARSIPAGRAVLRRPVTDRRPIRCSRGMAARSRAAPADAAGRCRPEATRRRRRPASLHDTTKALAPVAMRRSERAATSSSAFGPSFPAQSSSARFEQQVRSGLQLRQILDALADAALKCLLQRQADAGNADHRASVMQGVGKRGIELRAKAEQAGRIGRRQFEHPRKSGSSDQQMRAIRDLRINPVVRIPRHIPAPAGQVGHRDRRRRPCRCQEATMPRAQTIPASNFRCRSR